MKGDVLEKMVDVATRAMKYSNIGAKKSIGAAVLGSSGKIYGGTCLISIPQDYCAERVALLKAVSSGEKKIESVLVTWYDKKGKKSDKVGGPCGICLNALWQLSNNPNLNIILYSLTTKKPIERKIRDFYPYPYTQRIK